MLGITCRTIIVCRHTAEEDEHIILVLLDNILNELNVNLLDKTDIFRIWEIRMVNRLNQPVTRAEVDPLYWKA